MKRDMKKILGYTILGSMAGAAQAAIVRAALISPDGYMALIFEGIIALTIFGLWLVTS
jgi:hypothetical protein